MAWLWERALDKFGGDMKDLDVLVVDDDSAILSLIERMFSHFKLTDAPHSWELR